MRKSVGHAGRAATQPGVARTYAADAVSGLLALPFGVPIQRAR